MKTHSNYTPDQRTLNANGQEWKDLDLTGANLDRAILDPYTFGTLLLEIHCNVHDITTAAIRAQFESELQSKMDSAREVFAANEEAIYLQALADRATDSDTEDDHGEPYEANAGHLRVIVGEGGQRTIVGPAGYLRAKREAAEEGLTLAPWYTLEVYA